MLKSRLIRSTVVWEHFGIKKIYSTGVRF